MSGYSKQLHNRTKSLILGDGSSSEHFMSTADSQSQDEANPFSFKEFVKSKNFSELPLKHLEGTFVKDKKTSTTTLAGAPSAILLPESRDSLSVCLEYKDSFFKDPTVHEELLDEDEENWCGSYHPSVIERTHDASNSTSPSEESDIFDYSASDMSTLGPYQPWHFTAINACVSSSSPGSQIKADPHPVPTKDCSEDLHFHALKINNQELLEENSHLKKKITKLKEINQYQAEKVKNLEKKLEEKIIKEEKEAQDLESMVQQVENNLQMMTKRAIKAESTASRLKQEVALLQIQISTFKAENEALRRGETASMNAVKENANLALENLQKVVSGAEASIKQLLSGAEALTLVGELLRSIDKIAEIHEDDVP
ncbi:endosome-associated-trafficking regulator 1 [Discoglossus pictus]